MEKERKFIANYIYDELNKILELYHAFELGTNGCSKENGCDNCKLSKWDCELDGDICGILSGLREDVFEVGD